MEDSVVLADIFSVSSRCCDFPCFLEDQEIGAPASLNTYPDVECAPSVTTEPPKSASELGRVSEPASHDDLGAA
jgi:hypothetical protein